MAVDFGMSVEVLTDPNSLGSLAPSLWLRPEELLEDYGNTANATPILLWRDASGNNRDVTGSGSSAPQFYAGATGSRWFHPFAYFNGASSHYLAAPYWLSSILGTNGVGTIFVVGRAENGNAGPFLAAYSSTSAANATGLIATSAGVKARAYDGTADVATVSFDATVNTSYGNTMFGVFVWQKGASNIYGFCSRATGGLGTDGTASAASGTLTDINNQLLFGRQYSATYLTGAISEVIAFNSSLSAADRLRVAYYLNRKYGLAPEQDLTAYTWSPLADVIAKYGVQVSYGMSGTGVEDRVADTGRMSFVVDNSEKNSAATMGYYSPENPDSPEWWDVGTEVRLKLTYGGSSYYKWRGYIDSFDIIPSTTGIKSVRVNCVDYMDVLARTNATGITTLTSKRSDEVFRELMFRVDPNPPAFSIGYGQDTYPYALDNSPEEETAVMTEMQRLANSELGYVFVRGDANQGGTLVFETRAKRGQKTTPVLTIGEAVDLSDGAETMDFAAEYTRDNIINEVFVEIYPRRVDTAATTVVFTLNDTPGIARSTSQTFFAPYRDPSSGKFVRVGVESITAPVATTDYTFNTAADGTGTDITSQLTVVATAAASGSTISVLNNGPLDGYITKLQLRGKAIYASESVVFKAQDSESQRRFARRTTKFDMPYQSDPAIGLDAAYFILNQAKDAGSRLRSVTFLGNQNNTTALAALNREISDRIAVSERVTWGDSAGTAIKKEFFINAIELDISPGKIIRCTWSLIPADTQAYWILQQAGFTELGLTTTLSYGLFTPNWQLDASQLGVDTTINP